MCVKLFTPLIKAINYKLRIIYFCAKRFHDLIANSEEKLHTHIPAITWSK